MRSISREVKWTSAGAAALLATSLSGGAHAVTATDVVCNKCVDNQDMRARAVSGPKLKGDLEVGEWGSAIEPGRLRLRDQNGNNSNPIFEVIDLRGDFGIITAGAGPDDGELILRDTGTATTNGSTTVSLDGGLGRGTFGGGTEAGEVFVRDSTGSSSIFLDGINGAMTLGTSNQAGTLTVEDTDSLKRIAMNGSVASIDAGGRFDDGELFLRDFGTATTDGNITVSLDGGGGSGVFGGTGENGDLFIRNSLNSTTVTLSGSTGTVSNSLTGNGVVKAWCRVNLNGTIASGYRCSAVTKGAANSGIYDVDFTALSSNITGRPRLCTADGVNTHGAGNDDNNCSLGNEPGDLSGVRVTIQDLNNAANTAEDAPFTVMIF